MYEFGHARAQFEQPVELVGRVGLELVGRVQRVENQAQVLLLVHAQFGFAVDHRTFAVDQRYDADALQVDLQVVLLWVVNIHRDDVRV